MICFTKATTKLSSPGSYSVTYISLGCVLWRKCQKTFKIYTIIVSETSTDFYNFSWKLGPYLKQVI